MTIGWLVRRYDEADQRIAEALKGGEKDKALLLEARLRLLTGRYDEAAKLGRLQPAVECASPKIAAETGPNRIPGCFERRHHGRPSRVK